MFNPNWYYNPNCFNPQTYAQMQAQMHEQAKRTEVLKAVKAYRDLLDFVEKLDPAHQEELFYCCLAEFAQRKRW